MEVVEGYDEVKLLIRHWTQYAHWAAKGVIC